VENVSRVCCVDDDGVAFDDEDDDVADDGLVPPGTPLVETVSALSARARSFAFSRSS
jgi:hypothetical protein